MRKLAFIALGILLFVTNACASDSGILSQVEGDTRKVTNGRYWNSLGNEAKMSYLLAFGEGELAYSTVLNTEHIANELKISKEEMERTDEAILNKLNIKKNTGEIMDYLDKFYSEPLNINIPIHFVLSTLSLQLQGDNLDKAIQMFRENSKPTND